MVRTSLSEVEIVRAGQKNLDFLINHLLKCGRFNIDSQKPQIDLFFRTYFRKH